MTNWAKDHFIAPEMSLFTEADIPEVKSSEVVYGF
jgi:hypothetical protein